MPGVNGDDFRSFTYRLFIAGLAGLLAWLFYSVNSLQDFAAGGERFTRAHAHAQDAELRLWIETHFPPSTILLRLDHLDQQIDRHTTALRLELQRQQLQIDRLEGHTPKTYTKDQNAPFGLLLKELDEALYWTSHPSPLMLRKAP